MQEIEQILALNDEKNTLGFLEDSRVGGLIGDSSDNYGTIKDNQIISRSVLNLSLIINHDFCLP